MRDKRSEVDFEIPRIQHLRYRVENSFWLVEGTQVTDTRSYNSSRGVKRKSGDRGGGRRRSRRDALSIVIQIASRIIHRRRLEPVPHAHDGRRSARLRECIIVATLSLINLSRILICRVTRIAPFSTLSRSKSRKENGNWIFRGIYCNTSQQNQLEFIICISYILPFISSRTSLKIK